MKTSRNKREETQSDQDLAALHLPTTRSRFETSKRPAQDPTLPMRPGDPSQMADALMHDLEAIRRCRRRQRQQIEEVKGRPRGGTSNQAEPEVTPLTQLCLQLSSLTTQVRQLRHVMNSLNNSVQENTDHLEEVIDEFKDVDV